MTGTLHLPPSFLASVLLHDRAVNPYRPGRKEVGGYLVGNRSGDVIAATGPGAGSEHEPRAVTLRRDNVEPAVEAAGYRLVGCWHTHPHGTRPEPSEADILSWRLADTDPWLGIIVVGGDRGRWESIAAWRVRSDDLKRLRVVPDLTTTNALARRARCSASRRGRSRARRRRGRPANSNANSSASTSTPNSRSGYGLPR